jgi:hypothetical protein
VARRAGVLHRGVLRSLGEGPYRFFFSVRHFSPLD